VGLANGALKSIFKLLHSLLAGDPSSSAAPSPRHRFSHAIAIRGWYSINMGLYNASGYHHKILYWQLVADLST
jgi:hypothetical protein